MAIADYYPILIIIEFIIIIALAYLVYKQRSENLPEEQSVWKEIFDLNERKKVAEEELNSLSYKLTADVIKQQDFQIQRSNLLKKIDTMETRSKELLKILFKIQKKKGKGDKVYTKMADENLKLKSETLSLKENLSHLKKKHEALKKYINTFIENSPHDSVSGNLDPDILKKYYLYSFLLERYSDLINSKEKKSVVEIKSMINPTDLTVQSILSKFKPETYTYETNFLEVADQLLKFLRSEITVIDPEVDINFWLSPKEVIQLKLADDQDLAVLYCSLLHALGDKKAKVVLAEFENKVKHAFVVTEFEKKTIILDPSQEHELKEFFGKKDQILHRFSYKGSLFKRLAYEFNNKTYKQLL